MLERLEKYKNELEKARGKRAEWDSKVKALEKKVSEEEKTTIHEMVKAADLSPEQLSRLIAYSKSHIPGEMPVEEIIKEDADTVPASHKNDLEEVTEDEE